MANPLENPRILLDLVISVIANDLTRINDLGKRGKLSTECALDLVRYSGALININKDLDQEEQGYKKSLNDLSLDDLFKKAKELEKDLPK